MGHTHQTAQGAPKAAVASRQASVAPPERTLRGEQAAPSIVHDVLASAGSPLDGDVRSFMEGRFSHRFDEVRVHTDSRAAESAASVRAHAYTVGHDIVFGRGEYAPGTPAGRELIAHELVHTVQQRGLPRPGASLAVAEGGSPAEHEADVAARQALRGGAPRIGVSPDGSLVQRLQRKEYGTYVSTQGDAKYVDAGFAFYRDWGHPNVIRATTMNDVLTDLNKSTSPIDTFRIVSHGNDYGMMFGLMPEILPEGFGAEATEFTTESRFIKHFKSITLVSASFFNRIYGALYKHPKSLAMLTKLGGGATAPAEDTHLGILLRALVDQYYLANVKLPADPAEPDKDPGAPKIPNRAPLEQFNTLRITTYKKAIIDAAAPTDKADVTKAIEGLPAEIGPAMAAGGGLTFGALSQTDADTLGDSIVEDVGGTKQLKKDISKSVKEGVGGPFLTLLRSVRKKITARTHVEIRGCNIGKDPSLLDKLRGFFGDGTEIPSISAPDLFQYYFALSFVAYGGAASETAQMAADHADSTKEVASSFEDQKRIRSGELTVVVNEKKLSDLATKYGWSEPELRRLNPELADPNALTPGEKIWRVPRTEVPAGSYPTLLAFCKGYLNDEKLLPQVTTANPQLKAPTGLDPSEPDKSPRLSPTDRVKVPASLFSTPVASAAPTYADYEKTIRGGGQTVAVDSSSNKPVMYMDFSKWSTTVGKWLETQKFDPKGRTAAELTKFFAAKKGGLPEAAKKIHMQFLSRGYPTIIDPLFPDDPRYNAHIIKRP